MQKHGISICAAIAAIILAPAFTGCRAPTRMPATPPLQSTPRPTSTGSTSEPHVSPASTPTAQTFSTPIAAPDCPNPYPSRELPPEATPPFRITPAAGAGTPASIEALPFVHDAKLEQLIRGSLGDQIGSYGVAVKNMGDGSGTAVNGGKVFNAASLFKISVMYQVYYERAAGIVSFDTPLVMTPYYDSFGLGPRLTSVCQSLTVREALQAMMEVSDNAAAVLLQDLVGSSQINQSLAALGLRDTRLLEDGLPATAQDMALLLEAIARGQAVNAEASQEMVGLMSLEQLNDRLPALLPAGTHVAHKTANWSDATHDVGIVYSPAATYVVVVLSDKAYGSKPIAELSRLVYEYYNGPGSAATPAD
jgi:beta-lactamase class A